MVHARCDHGELRTLGSSHLPLGDIHADRLQAAPTGLGYSRRGFLQWVLVAWNQMDSILSLDKSCPLAIASVVEMIVEEAICLPRKSMKEPFL
jgi:hypothetical protein